MAEPRRTVGDWPDKAPTFTELVELGAIEIRVWAIEFKPSVPSGQAPSGREKPTRWKCCISCANAARPMVTATRTAPAEAEADAKRGFWQHFSKRPHLYPEPNWQSDDFPGRSTVSGEPKALTKPQRRAAEDLI